MSTRIARLLALGCVVAFMATLLAGCMEPVQPDPSHGWGVNRKRAVHHVGT
jgi:hypothetical protein